MKNITIVGCGVMGSHLINAMMNKGIKPIIVDLNQEAVDPFVARGATYASSLDDAEDTDLIFLNLPHHKIASSVLKNCKPEKLHGKMLIDTTTSTAHEVEDMAMIAKGCDMAYLDAKIECYPGDIGPDTGYLVYSGDKVVFDAYKDLLVSLGCAVYLGETVTLASITDIGVCNVHFGAIGSLLEAAAYCVKSGADVPTIIDQIRNILPIMFEGNLRAFAEELEHYNGNFDDASECTLAIETTAMDTLRRANNEGGVKTPVGDVLYELFNSGVKNGLGKKNVVSVVNEIM